MTDSAEIRIASDLYHIAKSRVTLREMANVSNEWNNIHKSGTAPRMLPEMVEFVVERLFPKYPPTVSYLRTLGEVKEKEDNSNAYYSESGQARWGAGHGGEG